MRKMTNGLVLMIWLLVEAVPVNAGVVDTPLPAPFTQHVFTVPGIMENGIFGTFFSCTNLDTGAVTIGVETFGSLGGSAGNDAVATSLGVPVGGTVMFCTQAAAGIGPPDSILGAGPFSKGSARVLSTSKKIACTAFVADRANAQPTSGWQLTIIKKTKQKAAN